MASLSENGKEAMGVMLGAMKAMDSVFDVSFRIFLECDELQVRVHLVLCGSLYCIGREKDFANLDQEHFSFTEMIGRRTCKAFKCNFAS